MSDILDGTKEGRSEEAYVTPNLAKVGIDGLA